MSIQFSPAFSPSHAAHNHAAPAQPAWQAGDVISAEWLSTHRGTATLQSADGFTFTAQADRLQGGVGDTLQFKVSKRGERLRLTQLVNREAAQAPLRKRGSASLADAAANEVKSVSQGISDIGEDDRRRMDDQAETREQTAKAIAAIKRAQLYMRGNAGRSAVAAIVQSGVSLQKISFDMYNRILHHLEKQPIQSVEPRDVEIVKQMPDITQADGEQMLESLHRQGLEANWHNLQALAGTWRRTPYALDDPATERLIAENKPLTIENAYKACHSVGFPERLPVGEGSDSGKGWQAPDDMLVRLFEREGIKPNRQNMEAARFLVARDLNVDAQTVGKRVFLQGYKPDKALVYEQAALCIAHDKPTGDIRLEDISAAHRRLVQGEAGRVLSPMAHRLSAELDWLRMAGASHRQAEALSEPLNRVVSTLATLQPLTANVHPFVLKNPALFTIQAVSEQVAVARANAGYEQFATVVSPRHGDSFSQVRGQFAPLLTGMGIAPTADNLKAAFILSKNNIDLEADTLSHIKEIDAKLTAVVNRLHPLIAANMLKEGLSPLDMHADALLAYIKRFNAEYGEDTSDKIARYILQMQKDGVLDGEARQSLTAVYRMLHIIQKDGAAALGLALRQSQAAPEGALTTFTLGGLMEFGKYWQTQRATAGDSVFDYSLDDAFGAMARLTAHPQSIRALLSPGQGTQAAFTYHDLTAAAFADLAEPDALTQMLADQRETPLEELLYRQSAKLSIPDAAQAAQVAKMPEMQAFAAAQPELVRFLNRRGIKASPPNLKAAEALSKSKNAVSQALRDAGMTQLPPTERGDTPPDILARLFASLGEASGSFEQVQAARDILALQSRLNSDSGFTLPVDVLGEAADLSLYVVNQKALLDGENGLRVMLSLDTHTLGAVQGFVTLSDGKADIELTVRADAAATLTANADLLTQQLEKFNIELASLTINVAEDADASTSTDADASSITQSDSLHEYRI